MRLIPKYIISPYLYSGICPLRHKLPVFRIIKACRRQKPAFCIFLHRVNIFGYKIRITLASPCLAHCPGINPNLKALFFGCLDYLFHCARVKFHILFAKCMHNEITSIIPDCLHIIRNIIRHSGAKITNT